MAATAQSHLERAELEVILRSGIFHRAPNLASFLRYVCERYFEGDAGQIKEYSIAVEALGRSADFDQKKDSIVRVEAFRLRKRLNDYYAGDGATHPVQIVIPNGGYVPQFIYINKDTGFENGARFVAQPGSRDTTDPLLLQRDTYLIPSETKPEPAIVPTVSKITAAGDPPSVTRTRWRLIGVALAVALVFGLAIWLRVRANGLLANEVWQGPSVQSMGGEYRLLTGYHGAPFVDRQGRTWQPDAYYRGGQSHPVPAGRTFEATPDPTFVRAFREGNAFQYDLPVPDGTYEIRLYFAESQYGMSPHEGDGGRLFRISLNDHVLLDLFDVLSEAGGPNRLHERVFRDVERAKDGKIHIKFEAISGTAFLNALEVVPSVRGITRPIRVAASETSVIDADGQTWSADQYSVGGRLVRRTESDVQSPSRHLYEGERYGNFSYHIPLPPGKYQVRLLFAETYFGTRLPYAPADPVGARVFNVFANGVALLRDFDIAKEAHGSKRGIEKVFDNLEPNAQGKIVLEFVPVRNYAEVNAIEVTQIESPS